MAAPKILILSITLLVIAVSPSLKALEFEQNQRRFEYQQAAQFTHLKWHNQTSPKIRLHFQPLENYSGVPLEKREADVEYFSHGKLPPEINQIYRDAFHTSRYFEQQNLRQADYRITLILDEYELPYDYAPDDHWYSALTNQAERWALQPATSKVKLSIKLTAGLKPIKTWMDSVEMTLSHCDVNRYPQPPSFRNNRDATTRPYLSSMPGQAFLAATNFLILQTIQRLELEPTFGRVSDINGQSIILESEQSAFTQGSQLKIFAQQELSKRASESIGKVQVIKTSQNRALAYPLTLRADHLKINDWVELGTHNNFNQPKSHFVAANRCAKVVTAQVSN